MLRGLFFETLQIFFYHFDNLSDVYESVAVIETLSLWVYKYSEQGHLMRRVNRAVCMTCTK